MIFTAWLTSKIANTAGKSDATERGQVYILLHDWCLTVLQFKENSVVLNQYAENPNIKT